MNKKFAVILLGIVLVSALSVVLAVTIKNAIVVNVNYCNETDAGLDFYTQGIISGDFWWKNYNNTIHYKGSFQDVCLDNYTLVEGVCGSSVSGNLSNLAAVVYVDCRYSGNSSNYTGGYCYAGRCW